MTQKTIPYGQRQWSQPESSEKEEEDDNLESTRVSEENHDNTMKEGEFGNKKITSPNCWQNNYF